MAAQSASYLGFPAFSWVLRVPAGFAVPSLVALHSIWRVNMLGFVEADLARQGQLEVSVIITSPKHSAPSTANNLHSCHNCSLLRHHSVCTLIVFAQLCKTHNMLLRF